MEKVIIYLPHVKAYLKDLVTVLFENDYFGFMESAEQYVINIRYFIEENIATYPPKLTPHELQSFGEKYISYKANRQTCWYIFYSQIGQTYFIKFISNNHTELGAKFNL